MSWDDLEPIVHTTPNCKASVTIHKDGIVRVGLSFSDAFYQLVGRPEKVDIQAGSGENEGKIRVALNPKGKFFIRTLARRGARVQIKAPPYIQTRVRDLEPCEIVERDAKAFVVALPMAAWAAQGAASAKIERTVAPAPKPNGEDAQPQTLRGKLDVVEYLDKKGVKVVRKGGNYSIDGSLETKMGCMTIVNRHRRAAGLEAIGLADFD